MLTPWRALYWTSPLYFDKYGTYVVLGDRSDRSAPVQNRNDRSTPVTPVWPDQQECSYLCPVIGGKGLSIDGMLLLMSSKRWHLRLDRMLLFHYLYVSAQNNYKGGIQGWMRCPVNGDTGLSKTWWDVIIDVQ